MNARELAALLGSSGLLRSADGLRVSVRVLDARPAFGRLDLLVEPVEGSGSAWVSADRVNLDG